MLKSKYLLQAAAVAAMTVAMSAAADAGPDKTLPVAEAIRAEALRKANDPLGRPLPLVSRWVTHLSPDGNGFYPQPVFHPDRQLDLVEAGHHLLPIFPVHANGPGYGEDTDAMRRAGAMKLPFTMLYFQPEWDLYRETKFTKLAGDKNPATVELSGKVREQISPFGPVEHWRQAGQDHLPRARMEALQKAYPEPPLVQWLSNNEPSRLFLSDAHQDVRYTRFCTDCKTLEDRRRIAAEQYRIRYRAVQGGMKDVLTQAGWKANSIFVGYDAFHWLGVFSYPGEYESVSEHQRADWWDGASPSYYVYDWLKDYSDRGVVSPQVGVMSWPLFVDEMLARRPDFWWEISTWDGGPGVRGRYLAAGEAYPVARYQGFVEFGMWVARPRVVREFQFQEPDLKVADERFYAIMEAVDRVHENPVLRRFWRKGTLVPHPSQKHPWSFGVPEKYEKAPRWFMLDADVNPPYPWNKNVAVPVFATALVLGKAPHREWLVLAQSPLKAYSGVKLTLPEFGALKVDTRPAVSFYRVQEAGRKVEPVK